MRIRRLCLTFALLSTLIFASGAQEDCSEFGDAASYATRGDIAHDQRLYDDVILDYTCAIQLSPDNSEYYNRRGNGYYRLQRDSDARQDYMRAVELYPEGGHIYNNIANLYAGIGDYEQAITYYGTALEYPTGNVEVTYTNRAIVFMDMGNYEKAQEDLDAAMAENQDYDSQYLAQASLNSIQNDVTEAARNYRIWLNKTQTSIQYPQYVLNRSYTTSMTTGDVVSIAFTMNAGDTFSASVAATDNLQHVDPLIVLIAPDGTAVISDDDSGVNIDAVISNYKVEATGSYTLLVGNAGGYYHEGVDGRIRISLQRKNADGTITVEPTAVPTAAPTAIATLQAAPTSQAEATPQAAATETPVESEEVTATFATFRLFVGVTAEIYTTAGDRLNLRGGPGLRFEILSKLDKGAFVTLLEGPRKQDGLAWWKVRTADGAEGWAVERVEEEQTLQMALTAGEEAIVTSDEDKLNVRTGAGRSNSILVQLPDGERITLLEVAPKLVDGYQWWRIQLADGREGWTIDRLEGERMLIPAKEYDGEG